MDGILFVQDMVPGPPSIVLVCPCIWWQLALHGSSIQVDKSPTHLVRVWGQERVSRSVQGERSPVVVSDAFSCLGVWPESLPAASGHTPKQEKGLACKTKSIHSSCSWRDILRESAGECKTEIEKDEGEKR